MNVVQINAVYEVRSTGRTTMELDQYLQKHNHVSHVVATRLEKEYPNVYRIGNRLEWYAHQGMSRLTGHQGYFSRHSTQKMLAWLDDINPDVVHLRNLRAGAFNYPMLFEYLAKNSIPTVLTLHDCFMFTGRCYYYTLKGCYQWETGCKKCPSAFQCEKSWFFDFCNKLYRDKKIFFEHIPYLGVIGVSEWITNEARRSFLKSATIVKRIYNWIDLDVFKPHSEADNDYYKKKIGADGHKVILGIASGLSKEKGLNELIAIARTFTDYKLVLVGCMSKDIDLPNNAIALGEIKSKEELSRIYSMADVFVNPSPQETFGKTTAESMSCGTPVIGYDMTATTELIGEDRGMLVDYKDGADGFIRAIERLFDFESDKISEYSNLCIEFANNNFNMETNIRAYIEVYEKLIERRSVL